MKELTDEQIRQCIKLENEEVDALYKKMTDCITKIQEYNIELFRREFGLNIGDHVLYKYVEWVVDEFAFSKNNEVCGVYLLDENLENGLNYIHVGYYEIKNIEKLYFK